jgi:hypothetical protein
MTPPPTHPIGRWRATTLAAACVIVLAAAGGAAIWYFWPPSDAAVRVVDMAAPGTHEAPATAPRWFRDVTAQSGVSFTYRNGQEAGHLTILESIGGGVALFDYDGDGLLDVFVTGGGSFSRSRQEYPEATDAYLQEIARAPPEIRGLPCKLYRNLGDWKFQDVTADVGLDRPWFYTHGASVADYDRDGWPDLLVTGYGRIALFHNEPDGKGGRRFVDVTDRVGLRDTSWSTSAGWADLDGDGWPDLYVCHYVDWSFANHPACDARQIGAGLDVCPPQRFKPLVHALFRNERGKTFRDVSAEHGFKPAGCGLGVVLVDVNDDGRPDIFVANDASNRFLFLNRGGKLQESAQASGVAVDDLGHYNGSMGVDAGDYDRSGRPALWVTNFQHELHGLFGNLGRELFDYQTRAAGLGALGHLWVGFGTGFLDVDNDGWSDLVIANGHVVYHPPSGAQVAQRPLLLHNVAHQGRRIFKDIRVQGGPFFDVPAIGRGVAIGDLDNDGWPDLVVSHSNSPVVLLRNEAGKSSTAHWLGLRLRGKEERDIVGSTVIVEGQGGKQYHYVKGGGSYLSARDARILAGLGADATPQRVTVRWSWGRTEVWENVRPDRYWELHEGQPAPRGVGWSLK